MVYNAILAAREEVVGVALSEVHAGDVERSLFAFLFLLLFVVSGLDLIH